jgi:hypothetical protein
MLLERGFRERFSANIAAARSGELSWRNTADAVVRVYDDV